jgi:transcriptional regulator with XRE-family HTH domain
MEFINLPNQLDTTIRNIKRQRKLKGYSQEYVASKLDISQNAYSKVELGVTKLTLEALLSIAEVLELQVAELINCP